VKALYGVTQVAAGGNSACAILTSGAVRCWGGNAYGQLGNGTTTSSKYPVKVAGIDGVAARATSISVGNGFACARITNGNVRCWGRNDYGQLGNGAGGNRKTPVTVMYSASAKLPYLTMVTAGGAHACAILAQPGYQADVYCWGRNADGQLGRGNTFDSRWGRYAIGDGFLGVTSLDAGDAQTLAVAPSELRPPNEAFAWGRNANGQLGIGDTAGRLSMVRLTRL
jgi:alpha-tubulin suppressor-like RCC1 family protein